MKCVCVCIWDGGVGSPEGRGGEAGPKVQGRMRRRMRRGRRRMRRGRGCWRMLKGGWSCEVAAE